MADRTYSTDRIRVEWHSALCIHTGRCLMALPEVFDVRRRPWVDVEAADADRIARAIELCPTGALKYERLDGAPGEQPPDETEVIAVDDGPLVLRGNLRIETPEGEEIGERETRVALCRCGGSRNQPFCDNSHLRRGFRSGPAEHGPRERSDDAAASETDRTAGGAVETPPTSVVPTPDGPLRVRGRLVLMNGDGEVLGRAQELYLCRCGGSSTKPLCDGTHNSNDFRSIDPDAAEKRAAESPAAYEPNPHVRV